MDSLDECERELEKPVDSLVSEVGSRYGADLNEMARIEALMDDIRLRNELIPHLVEIIRCRKLCERVKAEQRREIAYHVHIIVTSTWTHLYVTRRC